MSMITEDYVSFETAKLLKEKGFDQNCATYYLDGQVWRHYHGEVIPKGKQIYAAPTQAMAMKWLREVHNLCLFVIPATIDKTFRTGYALYPQCDSKWEWCASKNDRSKATFGCDINSRYCNSYEEACEVAINYCLENII